MQRVLDPRFLSPSIPHLEDVSHQRDSLPVIAIVLAGYHHPGPEAHHLRVSVGPRQLQLLVRALRAPAFLLAGPYTI